MNAEHWQKIKGLFDAAVELDETKRAGFLVNACAGDDELRSEIERMLASFDESSSFMEAPASSEVADLILDPKARLSAGQQIAHYQIVRLIGTGGMGEVYLAKDNKLDRSVAVKILNEDFSRQELNVKRFILEAKAASSLNHPNILVIHEINVSDHANYIVSEYVEGRTLRELIRESNLNPSEVLDIAIQISSALAAAHGANIVHRDIKPENIVVRPDGYVKVLDFGLAKLIEHKGVGLEDATIVQNQTAKGMILGTVNYMSPEQAKGEKVDQRTDIFSLGVVLYELMAGRTPFHGNSMSETLANLINVEPQPLSRYSANVPAELQRILTKTLRKSKGDRYLSVHELYGDLKVLRKRLDFESQLENSSLVQGQADIATQSLKMNTGQSHRTGGYTNSIAVLPFANMSADVENEYFCDGLAEELLIALAKIADLKVAARTSSFSFKNRNVEVSEIGNALNVNTILEGSVRKAGDRLRIAVQLINASNGYQIWSERYEGELKDVFDLQDRITLSVINELKVKFVSAEINSVRKRYAENVEAYQLYLKGRYHFLKLTPPETWKGIAYFEQAIAIEPEYALAYAGLAAAYVTFPLTSDGSPKEFFPKAKAAAEKAIEIDERLSETYAALFWVTLWYDWDWVEAERNCLQAIDLNPKSADGHEAYAHLLSNTGRHDEAASEIKRARELDPFHLRINALEGQFLLHAGRIDEALARLQKTLELEPRFWLAHIFSSSAYTAKGMYAEAIESAQKARDFSGSTHPIAFGGYALAKAGRDAEARALLDELLKMSSERYIPPPNIAMIYNGLGESDKALEWLERGYDARDSRMAFLKVEPKWSNLRSEPRFIALMKRMNLE